MRFKTTTSGRVLLLRENGQVRWAEAEGGEKMLKFNYCLLFDTDLGWRPSTVVDQQPHGIIIIIIYNNNNNNISHKGVD